MVAEDLRAAIAHGLEAAAMEALRAPIAQGLKVASSEGLGAAVAAASRAAVAAVVSTMRASTVIGTLVGRYLVLACAQTDQPEVGRLWRRRQYGIV